MSGRKRQKLERFYFSNMVKLPEEEFALHEQGLHTYEDNSQESEDFQVISFGFVVIT